MKYVLGIDIGTSGCKCILLDDEGKPFRTRGKEYQPDMKADGTVEQNPEEWFDTAVECLNEFAELDGVNLSQIVAVSVTGQMQGVTLLDKEGNPVRKSILWNDIRAENESEELNGKHRELFEKSISFAATPALTISKILWLKKHEPENWAKTEKFTFASNYISFRLTGCVTADENNITLSGMNDVKKNSWSNEIITLCGIEIGKVPALTGCFDVVGHVTAKAAEETGLKTGVPVVAGGGDAGAESYSIGIAGKSKMKVRLGTAADLNMVFHVDTVGDMDIWPGIRDVMRDYLLIGRYTKACAASVKWVRDVFYSEQPSESSTYVLMDQEASKVPLGSDGMIYHPYLSGENAPYFNPSLRARFSGMNIGHRRGHFVRAVYEGVSCSIRDVINSVEAFSEVEEVVFVGGGTKSKLWSQILADVLGKDGIVPEYCDAAYGAALMAGHGIGLWNGRETVEKNMSNSVRVKHNPQKHKAYEEVFKSYMALAGK